MGDIEQDKMYFIQSYVLSRAAVEVLITPSIVVDEAASIWKLINKELQEK